MSIPHPQTKSLTNRLYEINTATYLQRLTSIHDKTITLASIPDDELDRIASYGVDGVWLMGVWKRSAFAATLGLADQGLMRDIRGLLPDFQSSDMTGSAYAVSDYTVNESFGGEAELAILRDRLRKRGMSLILDFVPNHSAFDHEWTSLHPDYYIQATATDEQERPDRYRQWGGSMIARGRDPQFEPWPDVAQLNAFSPHYRQQSIRTLQHIARLCDGVRCDMAMLMMNAIFANTWGERAGAAPSTEYWTEVITATREQSRDFLFIAECYWNTEQTLLDQGFDYCYDKTLYDQLVSGTTESIGEHLEATAHLTSRLVHFLENHDEPRAAATFPSDRHHAAAHIASTLPGIFLLYEGQTIGYPHKIPVHIGREPTPIDNVALKEFYAALLGHPRQDTLSWKVSILHSHILEGRSDRTASATTFVNFSDVSVTIDLTRQFSGDITIEYPDEATPASTLPTPAHYYLRPWQIIRINEPV